MHRVVRKRFLSTLSCSGRQTLSFVILLLLIQRRVPSADANCLALINSVSEECLSSDRCQSNWTSLNIGDKATAKLNSRYFKSCSRLTELFIRNSSMDALESRCFRGLSNLKVLTLHNVLVRRLESGFFSELPSLTELTVSQGKISTLTAGGFKPCANLQKLVFDKTPLVKLETMLFSACEITLKTLIIRSGRLGKIEPFTFRHLSDLKMLDLSVNRLVKLSAHGFNDLSALRTLILKQNSIRSIYDSAFQGLTALTTLDLSSNRIASFPVASLIHMPYLSRLKLENNRILRLDPASIRSRITVLLRGNRLQCRPKIDKKTAKFEGLAPYLPLCSKRVKTTVSTVREVDTPPRLPPQRFEDKKRVEIPNQNCVNSNRQMILVTPPWLLGWAIFSTIAFVIVACILAFIFFSRRREKSHKTSEKPPQDQTAPLNGEGVVL